MSLHIVCYFCVLHGIPLHKYSTILLLINCSVVSDSATPWAVAHQASLSFTVSQSLLKLMSVESVMPSNQLILCHLLLFMPSIFPSIKGFSNGRLFASGGQGIGALTLPWANSHLPPCTLHPASPPPLGHLHKCEFVSVTNDFFLPPHC